MATLRDIRKRIRSVKSTQKITRAMKLVSAAKLKRAQGAIVAARPYAHALHEAISRIAARAADDEHVHPLLDKRAEPKRIMVIVLTSDRGMCGAFNANALRRGDRFLAENKNKFEHLELGAIGRRGRDHFRKKYGGKKHGIVIRREYAGVFESVTYATASKIAAELAEEFVAHDLDAVYFVYNQFKSAISQVVTVEQLLPIAAPPSGAATADTQDYLYEPAKEELLAELLPRYLATQIYRTLLESVAAEHGARMSAMESATKNASDMIGALTLSYNRARQAAITKELMEIISGAEAQKG